MIKIITRIILILLAAGLVSGVLYLTINNSSLSNMQSGGLQGFSGDNPPSGELTSENGSSDEATQSGNQMHKHEGGDSSFNSNSLFSLLMKVADIALVTMIIFLVSKLKSLFQRKKTIRNGVTA